MAQAMGVGRIYWSLVFGENSCSQGIQIRMSVQVADVFRRMPASQLPLVGQKCLHVAFQGLERIFSSFP